MDLLAEALAQLWEDAKDTAAAVLRALVFVALAYLQLRWLGLGEDSPRLAVVMILVALGAAAWFIPVPPEGRRTWTGHAGRGTWVDHPPPVHGPTLAAWACWILALACLLVMD